MERKTAAVIFGGQSSEHEVSCMSAANVIDRINKEKYDLLLIGITLDGHWIKTESVEEIRSGEWRNGKVSAAILPDATKKCAILMDGDKVTEVKLDLVFPGTSWTSRRRRNHPGSFRTGKDPICRLRCTGICSGHG